MTDTERRGTLRVIYVGRSEDDKHFLAGEGRFPITNTEHTIITSSGKLLQTRSYFTTVDRTMVCSFEQSGGGCDVCMAELGLTVVSGKCTVWNGRWPTWGRSE